KPENRPILCKHPTANSRDSSERGQVAPRHCAGAGRAWDRHSPRRRMDTGASERNSPAYEMTTSSVGGPPQMHSFEDMTLEPDWAASIRQAFVVLDRRGSRED